MIRIDFLIYTGIALLVLSVFLTVTAFAEAQPHRGCIASAYQAEMRGFDLQENLDACK